MKKSLLAVLTLCLLFPVDAQAQSRPKAMMPQGLQLSLVPGTTTPVAIRLVSPTAMTFCGDLSPIETYISRDLNFVDIDTQGYTVNQKREGGCKSTTKYASATIDIPPDELREFNVTQIRLWSGPRMDAYNVSITDEAFTLTPPGKIKFFQPVGNLSFPLAGGGLMATATKSMTDLKPFEATVQMKAQDIAKSNGNEVIVRIEGYPDADMEAQLTALMESRGLHPTEALQKQPGNISQMKAVDTGGQFAMQAKHTGPVLLGRIGSAMDDKAIAMGAPGKQIFDVYVTLN